MNAKILSEFLKTSDNPEIVALATALDEAREKIIAQAKIPESPESAVYWQKHKFVADISTDWDFYVKDKDSDEISHNLVLEWAGDSREDVVAQAMQYLSNVGNYAGSEKNIGYFIKSYVGEGFAEITEGAQDMWCAGGNWEIEFTYERPDAMPPEVADHKPHTKVFGQRVDLLTPEELFELGFVSASD